MKDHECVVGAFVRCQRYPLVGLVGYIRTVSRWKHSGLVKEYLVEDNYQTLIGLLPWINLDDWDMLSIPLTTKPMTGFTLTNNKAIREAIVEEYKSASALSKECPCGIHRADCIYHA